MPLHHVINMKNLVQVNDGVFKMDCVSFCLQSNVVFMRRQRCMIEVYRKIDPMDDYLLH